MLSFQDLIMQLQSRYSLKVRMVVPLAAGRPDSVRGVNCSSRERVSSTQERGEQPPHHLLLHQYPGPSPCLREVLTTCALPLVGAGPTLCPNFFYHTIRQL